MRFLLQVTKAFENKDADFVKNYFEDSDSAYLETEGGNVVYKGTAALTESYKWWFSGFGKVQYVYVFKSSVGLVLNCWAMLF